MKAVALVLAAAVLVLLFALALGVIIGTFWPLDGDNDGGSA